MLYDVDFRTTLLTKLGVESPVTERMAIGVQQAGARCFDTQMTDAFILGIGSSGARNRQQKTKRIDRMRNGSGSASSEGTGNYWSNNARSPLSAKITSRGSVNLARVGHSVFRLIRLKLSHFQFSD